LIYFAEERPKILGDDEAIFLSKTHERINRHLVRHMLKRCGHRAGVTGVHPHRFRHTFAIEYLRGGGNPYALPGIMGHSSMDMTFYYMKIAQVDIQTFHNAAYPVSRWLKIRKHT
jgi:site-specific recombinase XerD